MSRFPIPAFLTVLLSLPLLAQEEEAEAATPSENPIPRRLPLERYEAGWDFSPFGVKTNTVQAAGPGFADDLRIVGISIFRGKAAVTFRNEKTQDYTRLEKGDEDVESGLRLVEVNYDRDPKKASATVAKGEETALVRYSEKLFQARALAADPTGERLTERDEPGRSMQNPVRGQTLRAYGTTPQPTTQGAVGEELESSRSQPAEPPPAASRRRTIILPSAVRK